MFADLPIAAQLDVLLGVETRVAVEPRLPGDLVVERFGTGSTSVVVVAFDYSRHHGSIGPHEAVQIEQALAVATHDRVPVIFLMNTSGMRVTEGMATVAALRRFLRGLLDAVLQGQPLFAVITRNAFGGASIVASLCDRRVMQAGSLLAMSGPKLIEQIAGSEALRAGDRTAVAALMGGAARADVTSTTTLVDDSPEAYRAALIAWLAQPGAGPIDHSGIAARLQVLRRRLGDRGAMPTRAVGVEALDTTAASVVRRLLPEVEEVTVSAGVLVAAGATGGSAFVCGFIGGGAATARASLAIADAVFASAGHRSGMRVAILADVASHSAAPADEQVILSEYLALLALTLRYTHRRGNDVEVIVTGIAGGGIFAALAAGASRVRMMPGARLQVLPPAAFAALDKRADVDHETLEAALAAGAVDETFDGAGALG